jgi:hypothetical protein
MSKSFHLPFSGKISSEDNLIILEFSEILFEKGRFTQKWMNSSFFIHSGEIFIEKPVDFFIRDLLN